jgi:hypothetical protein
MNSPSPGVYKCRHQAESCWLTIVMTKAKLRWYMLKNGPVSHMNSLSAYGLSFIPNIYAKVAGSSMTRAGLQIT